LQKFGKFGFGHPASCLRLAVGTTWLGSVATQSTVRSPRRAAAHWPRRPPPGPGRRPTARRRRIGVDRAAVRIHARFERAQVRDLANRSTRHAVELLPGGAADRRVHVAAADRRDIRNAGKPRDKAAGAVAQLDDARAGVGDEQASIRRGCQAEDRRGEGVRWGCCHPAAGPAKRNSAATAAARVNVLMRFLLCVSESGTRPV